MPLTPTDVANKQFNIKMRGYALDEVDAFLDDVEGELARLLRENHDLRSRPEQPATPAPVAAAEPEQAAPPPPAPASIGSTEGQEAALRTLLLAQRTADEVVAEARTEAAEHLAAARNEAEQTLTAARTEAEQTLTAARTEAEQTLTAARTESDKLRGDARREADSAVSGARTEAEQTVSAARSHAEAHERETQARVLAATGDLEERQTALESRIEELRAFEREYRTRLRAYLENQLRDLVGRVSPDDDDRGAGVPAGARAAAVGLPTRPDSAPAAGRAAPGTDAVGAFGSEPPTGADPAHR